MPFNILLLPILGGYYFLSNHYYHKFKLQRLDSQRLLFNAILLGVLFSAISYLILELTQNMLPALSEKIEEFIPIDENYFGTGILSFLLGMFSAHILNRFTSEEEALIKAVNKWGDELDRLFLTAMSNREQLMLSLQNGKVYVGFVVEVSEPGKVKYYSILPTLSGYRTTSEHKVIITTDYFNIFEENEEFAPSLTYINSSNILTVKKFVPEIFNEFNSGQSNTSK